MENYTYDIYKAIDLVKHKADEALMRTKKQFDFIIMLLIVTLSLAILGLITDLRLEKLETTVEDINSRLESNRAVIEALESELEAKQNLINQLDLITSTEKYKFVMENKNLFEKREGND